jgi:hypothetical protein
MDLFFDGVPLRDLLAVFTDPAARSHGPAITVFRLTPAFKERVAALLKTSVGDARCQIRLAAPTEDPFAHPARSRSSRRVIGGWRRSGRAAGISSWM